MTIKTAWAQTGVYNAINDRTVAGLILGPSTNPLSGEGWVIAGMIPAARATPNWSVDVSAGRAVVATPASDGGAYAVLSDAVENVVVPPVSTQPRKDLIILEVLDADYAGATYQGQFRCVAGTAAASPVLPSLPTGAVKICELSHLANATSVGPAAIVNPHANGNPEFRTPIARLLVTATVDLPNNTLQTIIWGAHPIDTHGGHSTTINPTRWTCPVGWDGYYKVAGNIWIGPQATQNLTGVRYAEIDKNGVVVPGAATRLPPISDPYQIGFPVSANVALVAGDYIEVKALQNSGVLSKIYTDGNLGCSLDIEFIRRA